MSSEMDDALRIADCLARGQKYRMLDEEPEHCAGTMYSVLESLWTLRPREPGGRRT